MNGAAGSTLEDACGGAPFDAVAGAYDETFTASLIGRTQRAAVTRELDSLFFPGQRILELNCGTGVDAVHLASRGIRVVACDSSPCMIQMAQLRVGLAGLESSIRLRVLPNEAIGSLQDEKGCAPFDGAFSNFAGLNCTADLTGFACSLAKLLRPGAKILICVFGNLCVWESMWYLARGRPKKAFRRLGPGGDLAKLAPDVSVEVHYPSVRQWARIFSPHFRMITHRGVGVMVPPTCVESLAARFPRALEAAAKADRWLGRCPGIRSAADHVLLCFERW